MKKLFFLAAAAALYACGGGDHSGHDHEGHDHDHEGVHDHIAEVAFNTYGADFDTTGAKAIESLTIADGGGEGVFKATIVESCQKMGCWMKVEHPEAGEMMVFMNDHEFFVPKTGVSGLDCYISGTAYLDTVSVDFQKHLLEDANAAQEEIDAITEDKFEMQFNATGVAIVGYEGSEEEGEHDHDHDHEHGDEHDHGDATESEEAVTEEAAL